MQTKENRLSGTSTCLKLLSLPLPYETRKCMGRCVWEGYGWDMNGKFWKIKKYLSLIRKIELVLVSLVPLLGQEVYNSEDGVRLDQLQSWPWGMTQPMLLAFSVGHVEIFMIHHHLWVKILILKRSGRNRCISFILCIRMHTCMCISHTKKKANLKYFCCGRKVSEQWQWNTVYSQIHRCIFNKEDRKFFM